MPSRVFVVDDHAVVRRGLEAYFEMVDDLEIVGEAADGKQAPEIDVVAMTGFSEAERVERALQAGASTASLRTPQPLVDPLTKCEGQVLQLVAQGLWNRETADRLFVSERTREPTSAASRPN